jgi:hypothetical protein
MLPDQHTKSSNKKRRKSDKFAAPFHGAITIQVIRRVGV